MVRKNRMSVYDGNYHVTTRIAHRAMLLKDDSVKGEILRMIVSVAQFSGAFIGRDRKFLDRAVSELPKKFPRAGSRSIRRCRAFRWEMPTQLAEAA